VESTLGVGSRFWITARLGIVSGEPVPPQAPQDKRPGKLKGRVLVVEDEHINRLLVVELLTNVGLEVITAENGRLAVSRFQESQFDLVLMDIQMPELNGLDATRQIRALEEGSTVPIVALTANAFSSNRDQCLAAGMNDFLAKPVFPDALYQLLARHLPAVDGGPQTPAPGLRVTSGESGGRRGLLQEIELLAELLRTGNIEAKRQFYQPQADLKEICPAECEQLHQKIASYNFDATPALIDRIKGKLS
jgi:CheY-like chemotaxis protein